MLLLLNHDNNMKHEVCIKHSDLTSKYLILTNIPIGEPINCLPDGECQVLGIVLAWTYKEAAFFLFRKQQLFSLSTV